MHNIHGRVIFLMFLHHVSATNVEIIISKLYVSHLLGFQRSSSRLSYHIKVLKRVNGISRVAPLYF